MTKTDTHSDHADSLIDLGDAVTETKGGNGPQDPDDFIVQKRLAPGLFQD